MTISQEAAMAMALRSLMLETQKEFNAWLSQFQMDLIQLGEHAFEIAFFFWLWVTYGFHSCIMGKVSYVIPRLIFVYSLFPSLDYCSCALGKLHFGVVRFY